MRSQEATYVWHLTPSPNADFSLTPRGGPETALPTSVGVRLFLRSCGLFLLGLGPLLPLADQSCVTAGSAQLPVCSLFALEVRNLALLNGDLVADRQHLSRVLQLSIVILLAQLLDFLR